MKDMASCDKPWLGACSLRPKDLRITPYGEEARGELKHFSTRRKRNQMGFGE